jgi:hypothetical protein
MANLGNITCVNVAPGAMGGVLFAGGMRSTEPQVHKLAPSYYGAVALGTNVDMSYQLEGTVVEVDDDGNDVPVHNASVRLFNRQTDVIIERKLTDAAGYFIFDGLLKGDARYYIIAFYPNGNLIQNAKIYDRLTAVQA